MVLLHGFVKRRQAALKDDPELARARLKIEGCMMKKELLAGDFDDFLATEGSLDFAFMGLDYGPWRLAGKTNAE